VGGYNLVAQIFVREINDELTSLVKKIDSRLDESMSKHKPQNRYGVFVVLFNDDARMQQKLKDLASKGGLKQVVFCIGNAQAAKKNRIAGQADVTVAVYNLHQYDIKVTTNFALKKGELTSQKADAIFGTVTGVLPR
jgi:hypothetical protein